MRGIILLRINALAKGYSGVRLSTINTLIDMLNKGVYPVIPEKGSLGASGDSGPPYPIWCWSCLGEGEAYFEGELLPGKEAMDRAGIPIVELTSKEGLALINGTQVMTSIGALVVYDSLLLSKMADVIAALTVEALNGIVDAFDERIHKARAPPRSNRYGKNLLKLLEGSEMILTTRGN